MRLLKDILYKVDLRSVAGSTNVEITDVQTDSRKIVKGSLFIAIKGEVSDGHKFIEQAVEMGATVVVGESFSQERKEGGVYVEVKDSAMAAGYIAHHFYDEPSAKLKLIGVTGTNGKTTIATLLYKLFTSLGYTSGLLSTIENKIGSVTMPATHTTPDAVSLNG